MVVPFLAAAAVLSVFVALGAGWRRHSFRDSPTLPRQPWLLLLAMIPQLAWGHWLSRLGPDAERLVWILPLSYLPVLGFIAVNRRLVWIRIVAVGVAMNLAVMVFNGGAMPAPARFAASEPAVARPSGARLAPGTKDRIVAEDQVTPLGLLEDRFVVTLPGGHQRLASLGDFVSLGGALLGLVSVL